MINFIKKIFQIKPNIVIYKDSSVNIWSCKLIFSFLKYGMSVDNYITDTLSLRKKGRGNGFLPLGFPQILTQKPKERI